MEMLYTDNFEPVPPVFLPEGKDEMFSHCKLCGKELLEADEHYLIEKAYQRNVKTGKPELVVEFAYCMECALDVRKELSEESMKRVQEFMDAHVDFEAREQKFAEHNLFDCDSWLTNCIITGKAIDEVSDYQIVAACEGSDMLYLQTPYMICGEAMEQIAALFSQKTTDALNDFLADLVDFPPELESILKSKLIFV